MIAALLLINRESAQDLIVDQELSELLGLADSLDSLEPTDLYFSQLESIEFPQINLEDSLSLELDNLNIDMPKYELGEVPVPEVSLDSSIFNSLSFDISNISFPQGGGSGFSPNAQNCAVFAMAPSCSFVPADSRKMCEDCKNAGF